MPVPLLAIAAHSPRATRPSQTANWGVGGGGHKASVFSCLPLAAPIGLSPLLILTPCGPERVLVVSTEPLDMAEQNTRHTRCPPSQGSPASSPPAALS